MLCYGAQHVDIVIASSDEDRVVRRVLRRSFHGPQFLAWSYTSAATVDRSFLVRPWRGFVLHIARVRRSRCGRRCGAFIVGARPTSLFLVPSRLSRTSVPAVLELRWCHVLRCVYGYQSTRHKRAHNKTPSTSRNYLICTPSGDIQKHCSTRTA